VSVADRAIRPVIDPLAQSLPGLKCGTCLPESATASPVLGLRLAWRPEMQREAAKPRSRCAALRERITHDLQDLLERELNILRRQSFCLAVMISMSSDFVMRF
jgi:hypothetical protein